MTDSAPRAAERTEGLLHRGQTFNDVDAPYQLTATFTLATGNWEYTWKKGRTKNRRVSNFLDDLGQTTTDQWDAIPPAKRVGKGSLRLGLFFLAKPGALSPEQAHALHNWLKQIVYEASIANQITNQSIRADDFSALAELTEDDKKDYDTTRSRIALPEKPEPPPLEFPPPPDRRKELAKPSLPKASAILCETLETMARCLAEQPVSGENRIEQAEVELHPLRVAIAAYLQQMIRAEKLDPRPSLEEGKKQADRLNDLLACFGLRFQLRPGEEIPATLCYLPVGSAKPGMYFLQAVVSGKNKKEYLGIDTMTGKLDISKVQVMLAPRIRPGPRFRSDQSSRSKK